MKMERDRTTESWNTVSVFFLRPIWTMFWCRIRCWQIYNQCTLCRYAALQATVLQPASSWFSLSTHSRCGEYLRSHGEWEIHYSRSICNFVKFNFLPFNKVLSPYIQARWLFVSQLASTLCGSAAVTTTDNTTIVTNTASSPMITTTVITITLRLQLLLLLCA